MFVEYRDLGQMDYKACWEYQQRLFDTLLRAKGTPAEGAGCYKLAKPLDIILKQVYDDSD